MNKSAYHKSHDFTVQKNIGLISSLNSEIVENNNFNLSNSLSSNHLFGNSQNGQNTKDFQFNIKESRNLLNEYKENLRKFDCNINEIKDAINNLKMSLINYKSLTDEDDESDDDNEEKEISPKIKKSSVSTNILENNKNNEMIGNEKEKILDLKPNADKNGENFNAESFFLNKKIKKIEYEDNSFYEGCIEEENIRHGIGKFHFSEDKVYIGEWEKDEISGFGVLYFENKIVYEGFWEHGSFKGKGILYNIFPSLDSELEIDFKDLNTIYNRWKVYQGDFNNDLRHGKGKIDFLNGDSFTGNFKENLIDGLGVFERKIKNELVFGLWKENLFIKLQEN